MQEYYTLCFMFHIYERTICRLGSEHDIGVGNVFCTTCVLGYHSSVAHFSKQSLLLPSDNFYTNAYDLVEREHLFQHLISFPSNFKRLVRKILLLRTCFTTVANQKSSDEHLLFIKLFIIHSSLIFIQVYSFEGWVFC